MIRVLHVVSILNAGGMENYIMNLYHRIDRSKIQFDFLVHHQAKGLFEDEITQMGGKVYHLAVLDDKNLFKYRRDLKQLFSSHPEYQIIHGHLASLAFIYLRQAKKSNLPWRIAHSHGAGFLRTPKGFAKYVLFRGAKHDANVRFACSTEAGRYLFGKDAFEVIPNGVDAARFSYQPETRAEIRQELKLENAFVIGHVGRFAASKNHGFLLALFKKIVQVNPNARLLLLGDGELREVIENKVKALHLQNEVLMPGVKKDCERYYQAMDVFVLPSLYEGLPVAGIEAQYAGLRCIFSNRISKEAQISSNVVFLGIGAKDIPAWLSLLAQYANDKIDVRAAHTVNTTSFDSIISTNQLATKYQRMWRTTKC